MTRINRKKVKKFHVLGSARCSLLSAEGFSCSLDFLYGGLGISKLLFLFPKIFIKNCSCKFFRFLVIKAPEGPDLDFGSGSVGIQPKMLDPYPDSMNPDRKHWVK
jgi:hypothetical protein